MADLIDDLIQTTIKIEGRYVIAKPLPNLVINRIKDVWGILTGKYLAVRFYKQ